MPGEPGRLLGQRRRDLSLPQPATRACSKRRSAFVEWILERFPVLSIELAVARTHAQLWAELHAKGSAIGAHDLWLAASCVALGHALVTRNVREFKRVPGLKVEAW